ncbi:LLM class flavin-dependent oxidoreductase [Amycolatopsis magusensis]|uniref:Alkanesulfonate monooxygenase SsuD/methylene tetrahydromethanopterin reductase-like flavin-dependent oxidoreductase (Luciferase family) n=1 Tax=Amycolatopsis magusensis TaxID=882444 RepID=A0ABS4PGV2_9PSEU|nr:LLM class flavin-dependent oxidoreductase [Amycolatopsis magusensis]MBP2178635.1 alkanesulfonate monooxygenase SsuD/methylene tetrahydromethanopterin reductase-like flavin-dependent oxidoreductase (luciferase family) [Amycolatopsis magusensis]
MKLGVYLDGSTPDSFVAHARRAEDAGLESVWVGDHLITASPRMDSIVALTAAAAATTRVKVGFGVLVAALRPTAWVAKQIATLQALSGNRVLLGIGTGGDAHGELGWRAAGVPFAERGKRTTAMLEVLPDLVAGRPATVDGVEFALAPGAEMPPLIIGSGPGLLRRVARFGDEWFPAFSAPAWIGEQRARLAEFAAEYDRPVPGITVGVSLAVGKLPDSVLDAQVRSLTGYGMSEEQAREALVTGSPAEVAERLAVYADAGVHRIAAMPFAGDRGEQIDLLGEVAGLLR